MAKTVEEAKSLVALEICNTATPVSATLTTSLTKRMLEICNTELIVGGKSVVKLSVGDVPSVGKYGIVFAANAETGSLNTLLTNVDVETLATNFAQCILNVNTLAAQIMEEYAQFEKVAASSISYTSDKVKTETTTE